MRRQHQHAFEAEVDAAGLLGQAFAQADNAAGFAKDLVALGPEFLQGKLFEIGMPFSNGRKQAGGQLVGNDLCAGECGGLLDPKPGFRLDGVLAIELLPFKREFFVD